MQMNHGSQVKIFAKLLGSLLELKMIKSVNVSFDVDDLFHYVDALVVFSLV
jgi:hypothetical protein